MSSIFLKPIKPNIRLNRKFFLAEYSLKPNIRANIRVKSNIRFWQIIQKFITLEKLADFTDYTEYSGF